MRVGCCRNYVPDKDKKQTYTVYEKILYNNKKNILFINKFASKSNFTKNRINGIRKSFKAKFK